MKVGSVNSTEAVAQHSLFIETLRTLGAKLTVVPFLHGNFDSVFAKDNVVIFDDGNQTNAILGKPSTVERSFEQALRKEQLEAVGIKVVGESASNLEGGDLVVLTSREKIFFGHGMRSSFEAIGDLRRFTDYEIVPLELVDPFFFHLDTALNILQVDGKVIAFAYRGAFSELAWEFLSSDSDIDEIVEVSRDEALKFGLNWVEVGNFIILGSLVPQIVSQLESYGREVVISPLNQFQLAGGSAACLVSKVHCTHENRFTLEQTSDNFVQNFDENTLFA